LRVLTIIRRGRNSIHGSWINQVRNLCDIGISTYVEDLPEEPGSVLHHLHKGTKQEALHDLFTSRPDLLDRYDYVWCLEDDLHVPYESAWGIFNALSNRKLSLCAPALTYYSHFSWASTIANDALRFRGVDFIETMAPIFSVDLLREVLPGFLEFPIWGCCVGWKNAMHLRGEIGIQFDEFPIVHTRPVGGGELYKLARRPPQEDLDEAYRRYNGQFGSYGSSWFGMSRDGRVLTGDALYHAMHDGYGRFFGYHPQARAQFEAERWRFEQDDNRFIERLNFNVRGDVLDEYNRLAFFPDMDGLLGRSWVYGSTGDGDYRTLRFHRDGSIDPGSEPNEARWSMTGGHLCLLDRFGRPAVVFDRHEETREGVTLRGDSLLFEGLSLYLRAG